jgi:hypothetical protein
MDRLWRKQRKIEAALGENCQRPKWMRAKTYEHLWAQIGEMEERKDLVCWSGIAGVMRRGGMTFDDSHLSRPSALDGCVARSKAVRWELSHTKSVHFCVNFNLKPPIK